MRRALAVILALAAAPAAADTFLVPLSPSPTAGREAQNRSWELLGAALFARGPGLSLSGAGAGWGLQAPAGEEWRLHVHSQGYLLKGQVDPGRGAGRKGMTMGLAELGVSLSRPLARGLEGSAGLQVMVALGHLDGSVSVTASGKTSSLTPSDVYDVYLGVPLGLSWRVPLGHDWTLAPSLSAAAYGAGAEFYLYSRSGPLTPDSAVKIAPFFSAGGAAAFTYEPWLLTLEAGLRQTSSRRGQRALAVADARLLWRWR